MTLMKWRPEREIETWRNHLTKFWENPFRYLDRLTEDLDRPAIDVYDRGDHLVLEAEIPGVKKEDLEIRVHPGEVLLKGETHRDTEHKDGEYYHQERYTGSFMRRIPLPDEVLADQAQASYKHGVLELTMPKKEPRELSGKKVDIDFS